MYVKLDENDENIITDNELFIHNYKEEEINDNIVEE